MRACGAVIAIAMAMVGSAAALAEDAAPIDLLAFSNGALIERATTAYGSGWQANWLIDEDPKHGWASVEGAVATAEFVISLPERSRIDRVGFSTGSVEEPDEAAKDVEVLVSDQSATAGFVSAATITLAQAQDDQSFALQAPAVGRWVKVVVKSNYGSARYIELMDLHAYGVALTTTPLPNVSGTYTNGAYGRFHLSQKGAALEGCYEYQKGLVQGGLEAHLMRLTWSENGGSDSARSGPVVMVLDRDGKSFEGWWKNADEDWHDDWALKKTSDQIGSCPHWKPAGGKDNIVAASLGRGERVRLYGINFDTDSDVLRADAKPALDELAAALKANAGWRVMVEGHTDSSSTPAHNLDLSRRRSLSVRAYLIATGIPANRLDTVGYGQEKPIAPNETALGRAQNRRVEVVRQ